MNRQEQMIALINNSETVREQVRCADEERLKRLLPPRTHKPHADYGLKAAAHAAVTDAIRAGRLVRPTKCEMTGHHSKGKLQAHHHRGYVPEYWLDVQWLCPRHHALIERAGD